MKLYDSLFPVLGPFKELLDLGCGEGPLLLRCRERNLSARGLDIKADCVDLCRRLGLRAQVGDLFDVLEKGPGDPLPDVWAFCHVIEHFDVGQVRHFFGAAKKWLPSGGRLIIVTPNSKNLGIVCDSFWRDLSHVRLYPRETLAQMGHNTGLQIVSSGIDEAAAPRGMSRAVNHVRRWLVGDYFTGPDAFVIFRKS